MVWQSRALTCSRHVENTCDLLERRLFMLWETPRSKANLWETVSADSGCCRWCALGVQNHGNMLRLFNCKEKQIQCKEKLSGADCSFMPFFVVTTLGTSATFLFVRLGLRCTAAVWPESKLRELQNTFYKSLLLKESVILPLDSVLRYHFLKNVLEDPFSKNQTNTRSLNGKRSVRGKQHGLLNIKALFDTDLMPILGSKRILILQSI